MTYATITVSVKLKVVSERPLTDNDRKRIIEEVAYEFDFSEKLNGNFVRVTGGEIAEVLAYRCDATEVKNEVNSLDFEGKPQPMSAYREAGVDVDRKDE